MALTIYVNTDTSDSVYPTSGVDWYELDPDSDKLLFTAGNATVADGEAIPSASDLNAAGTLVSESAAVYVDKCFLQDNGSSLIREINNFGNVNKRYVYAFSFSAATASEPVLELWDDSGLDSTDNYSLGAGTPADSWWYGICTTDAAPAADWVNSNADAVTLAGSTDDHYILLNAGNGALGSADVLYCNLAIKIPINPSQSGSETPILVVKYTAN